jgi:N-acylneuraminate cytidylyltransferase
MRKIAFIPARSGSKRIPDKNIYSLGGHPMMSYSIRAAIDSGIFDDVVCVTDSKDYADIAKKYGAEVPKLRPSNISGDISPDIEWVRWILSELQSAGRSYDVFSILRPTSPFRTKETIIRAWSEFSKNQNVHSLRAVEKCSEHPGKMWVIRNKSLLPLLPLANDGVPWHSSQYANLPEIFVQNASLEIAWTSIPMQERVIAGEVVVPFITENFEGFDINKQEDILLAEHYISSGIVSLPLI